MSDVEREQPESGENPRAEQASLMDEAAEEATRPEELQPEAEETSTPAEAGAVDAVPVLDVQDDEPEAEAEHIVEMDVVQQADAEGEAPRDEAEAAEFAEMAEAAADMPAEEGDTEAEPAGDYLEAIDEEVVDEPGAAKVETDGEQAPPYGSAAEEPLADVEAGEPEIEAADEIEVEAPPDDDRLWYVIHCYSGQENKVRHNLEQRIDSMGMKDRIFDVVVPTEEEIEVKDGKRRTVERRVFPGYILVQMILTEESWYVVRNTPGVTGFVGMGNEPTPLRPEEVSQIIKRMEAEAPRIKVTYKIGQKVRIIDGPFNDFIGTVDDIDMERAKVRVMVSFFGRETPVELDFLQVEKA